MTLVKLWLKGAVRHWRKNTINCEFPESRNPMSPTTSTVLGKQITAEWMKNNLTFTD